MAACSPTGKPRTTASPNSPEIDADVAVRGLRRVADMEHEEAMAAINRHLRPGFEVLLFFPWESDYERRADMHLRHHQSRSRRLRSIRRSLRF